MRCSILKSRPTKTSSPVPFLTQGRTKFAEWYAKPQHLKYIKATPEQVLTKQFPQGYTQSSPSTSLTPLRCKEFTVKSSRKLRTKKDSAAYYWVIPNYSELANQIKSDENISEELNQYYRGLIAKERDQVQVRIEHHKQYLETRGKLKELALVCLKEGISLTSDAYPFI